MRMMLELFGRLKMIEIIFYTLLSSMLVFGLVIFIKMHKQRLPMNENKDVNPTTIESKTLVNPKIEEALTPKPEIINPKLTQVIKEAAEERETIQLQREKELYEKVLKERDRLLEDDYIYKLIKEAIVNNHSSVEIKSDEITITEKAVRSIPGLYLPPRIIGCFNYGCGNVDREELSSVTVYFKE
jgi:hypothetical protein